VRSLGFTLVSELFPHLLGEGDVERGTQAGGTGETVGRGSVEELDTSDTVGTVRNSDGGDVLLGDIDRVPKVLRSAYSETQCRVSNGSGHDRSLRWLTFPPRREIFSARDKEERTASTSKSFDSDLEPGRRDESPTMFACCFSGGYRGRDKVVRRRLFVVLLSGQGRWRVSGGLLRRRGCIYIVAGMVTFTDVEVVDQFGRCGGMSARSPSHPSPSPKSGHVAWAPKVRRLMMDHGRGVRVAVVPRTCMNVGDSAIRTRVRYERPGLGF
jgi:hypothetical protein